MKNYSTSQHLARAAMLLLVAMLTSIAAWATDVTYTYTYTETTTSDHQAASKITSSSTKEITWRAQSGTLWTANATQSITETDFTINFTPSASITYGFKEEGTFTIATAESDGYYIRKVTINYKTSQGSTSTPVTAINSNTVVVPVAKGAGSTGSINDPISYEFIVELTDQPYYLVTPAADLKIVNTNGFAHESKTYFHPNTAITIAPTSPVHVITATDGTVSEATIAQDKRSFSFKMPSQAITPSATLEEAHIVAITGDVNITDPLFTDANGNKYYKYDDIITISAKNTNDIIDAIDGFDGIAFALNFKSASFLMPSTDLTLTATTSEVHTVSVPSNLTISKEYKTIGGTKYYKKGEPYTLTVNANNQIIFGTPTVNGAGATLTVADDKKSIFLTIGSANITSISATLATLSGSGGGVSWLMTDKDGDHTYETLTINGNGEISSSPWADYFAASIERVNINNINLTISGNPFDKLSDNALIVIPTLEYAVQYKNTAYASKLRVLFGSQIFPFTDTDRDGNAATLAYAIATADDLLALAAAVNSGENTTNLTFRQTADIAFDHPDNEDIEYTENYVSIGNSQYNFYGHFDGDGHIISGIRIRKTGNDEEDNCQGLFGCVFNANIHDIHLTDARIQGNIKVGGIVGVNQRSTISHTIVTNSVIISSGSIPGAICGKTIGGTLTNNYYQGCGMAYGFYDPYGWGTGSDGDNGATPAFLLTLGNGITITTTATPAFSYLGKDYYAQGTEFTITPADDNKAFTSVNVKDVDGTIATIAADKRSATFVPSSDATVSAKFTTIYTIDGESGDPVSFSQTIRTAMVVFNRTFTQGVNSTIILPFGFTLDDDFKTNYGNFYSLQTIRYNETKKQWEGWLDYIVSDKVEANTPYIFVPAKDFTSITFYGVTLNPTTPKDVTFGDGNEWTFKGVYEKKVWTERQPKIYGFAATTGVGRDEEGNVIGDIAVGEFVRAGINSSVRATRAYLEYSGNDAALSKSALSLPDRIIVVFPDETASVIDNPVDDPSTGGDISTPTSEIQPTANVKVWSYDKTIFIQSHPGTDYRIIDASGRPLRTSTTQSDRDEIHLGGKADGIVIVIIGGKAYKIRY